jgi:NhaA family Na+:H+ antiporter
MHVNMGRSREIFREAKRIPVALIRPFQAFVKEEVSGGILLLAAALVAFAWANSRYGASYHHFWEAQVSLSAWGYGITRSFREWINEGLMAVFFFIVGLEIKREVLVGELASARRAILPVGAAFGGMLFPAFVYLFFNWGMPSAAGWGIPMATDIAFALGALYVLGKKVPFAIRIFLSALAIVDDLGAVLIIALFYTKGIVPGYLLAGLGVFVLLVVANLLWLRNALVYGVLGLCLWLALLGSGLHATVAGIIVAFCIPARGKYDTDKFVGEVKGYLDQFECLPEGCGFSILLNHKHMDAVQSIELACHHVETPLQRFERSLHAWVAFLIVPLFALANAGLTMAEVDMGKALVSPVMLGVSCGLIIGKPLGIAFFSFLLVKMKAASLSEGVRWSHIVGAGILGGIGFTMSLFVTGLSFAGSPDFAYAKVGVFIGSVVCGTGGMLFLLAISGSGPAESDAREDIAAAQKGR